MILNNGQRRGLNYVEAANRGGYYPSRPEVDEWRLTPEQKPGPRGKLLKPAVPGIFGPYAKDSLAVQGWSNFFGASLVKSTSNLFGTPAEYEQDGPPEDFIDHLIRLGWLRIIAYDRLQVTDLGRALMRADDQEAEGLESANVSTVVLAREDALAYPTFIGVIVDNETDLIVDPYMGVEQLISLVTLTSVQRILVGPNLNVKRIAELKAVTLGLSQRTLELRQAAEGQHDRFLVGTKVMTVGASINGIGKSTTVLSPMADAVSGRLVAEIESWWHAATLLAASNPEDSAQS